MSILIKDTSREERERIVAESIGNISGSCDGCAAGFIHYSFCGKLIMEVEKVDH